MKKTSLLQVVIIGFGLLAGFTCLKLVPGLLYYLFMWAGNGLNGGVYMDTLVITILSIAIYLIACLYGIKYSRSFAERISQKTGADLYLPANMNMKYVFYIVLFSIGLFGIIDKLPTFLTNTYTYIKSRNSLMEAELVNESNGATLLTEFITLAIYLILMVYGHVFAELLDKRIDKVESPSIGENNA